MKLFIDTSDSERIVVGLNDKKFTTSSKKERSQMLLSFIDQLLTKKGKKIQDVSEIEVVTGPGSFTGLRVGVSVANTIGWLLDIPVNGQKVTEKPVVPTY